MSKRWPVSLVVNDGRTPRIVLRPLGRRDRAAWERLRRESAEYLARWEPTPPDGVGNRVTYSGYVRAMNDEARAGTTLPFAIEVDGHLAGQVHLFGITRGSLMSAAAGYWIGPEYAGQGLTTRALAEVCDYAFGPMGLHRVEVNVRPENAASLAVVAHVRMRDEGVRERYMHIEGRWCDHRTFALTVEELEGRRTISRWVESP
ncbi:MAG: GNAT family N-acetyltransferase [Actinomycetales bacterium]|nr:GNAT family N-acetyltransferase [Actinomycetales bacterium]